MQLLFFRIYLHLLLVLGIKTGIQSIQKHLTPVTFAFHVLLSSHRCVSVCVCKIIFLILCKNYPAVIGPSHLSQMVRLGSKCLWAASLLLITLMWAACLLTPLGTSVWNGQPSESAVWECPDLISLLAGYKQNGLRCFLLCYWQNCVTSLYTWWSANSMRELKKWFLSLLPSLLFFLSSFLPPLLSSLPPLLLPSPSLPSSLSFLCFYVPQTSLLSPHPCQPAFLKHSECPRSDFCSCCSRGCRQLFAMQTAAAADSRAQEPTPSLFVSVLWWFLKRIQEMKPGKQIEYKKSISNERNSVPKNIKLEEATETILAAKLSCKWKRKNLEEEKEWVDISCISSLIHCYLLI